MIKVTERAEAELKTLLGEGDKALRLLVQKGGCAGHQYGMKLDQPEPADAVVETANGKVVVDPESLAFLDGSVLDYSDSLSDNGFKIVNPNAARSCGCGTSFEPSDAEAGKAAAYDPALDNCGGED